MFLSFFVSHVFLYINLVSEETTFEQFALIIKGVKEEKDENISLPFFFILCFYERETYVNIN
jgi:hypothetical protein